MKYLDLYEEKNNKNKLGMKKSWKEPKLKAVQDKIIMEDIWREPSIIDNEEIKIAIKSTLKRPRMINTNNETLSINPSNDAMMIDTLNKFIIRCLLSGMIYVLYG